MRKIKRRKTSLIIILLILVFFISIGYASISTTLNVNGTTTIKKPSSVVPDSVTVTFDANGGTVNTNTKDVEVGSQYGELPTPTREGYTFLGWEKRKIPNEYQEVEYIESTGTQYILTDIMPNNDMGMYIKVASKDISTDCVFVGSIGNNSRFYIANNLNKLYFGWNDYTPASLRPTITRNDIFTAKLNYLNSRTNMYNDTIIENITSNLVSNTKTIAIFAANYSGINYKAKIKLYELKISEDEEIAHDFIPCYRKVDNEIGLYDLNEGIFYSNSGLGTFEKGQDVNNFIKSTDYVTTDENHTLYAKWGKNIMVTFDTNGGTVNTNTKGVAVGSRYGELPTTTREGYRFLGWKKSKIPNEYQEVEYIESSGTQYILTDIMPNNNMGIYIKVASKDISSDCVYAGSSGNSSRFYIANQSSKLYFGWNENTKTSLKPTISRNVIFTAELNYLNSKTNIYNDTIIENITSNLASNTETIAIFAANYGGINYKAKIKLYELKISENKENTHDFIPCYRKSDNEMGLYDVHDGIFYTNLGSGTFEKGEDVNNYIESTDYVVTDEDHTLYAVWEEDEE